MLPDLDGFEVARRLRQAEGAGTRVPIIFLSARDTTRDKVEGLRLGSDDYVTKPFSIEELVERVKAVLRRSTEQRPGGAPPHLRGSGDGRGHPRRVARRSADRAHPHGVQAPALPAGQRPAVLTREQILEHVWDYTFAGNASVLETYVSYLRHKIDQDETPLIHTVRGVGYSLRLPR